MAKYCHEMWEVVEKRPPTRNYEEDVKMWEEDYKEIKDGIIRSD